MRKVGRIMNKALAYFGLGLLAISIIAAACSPSPAPEKPTSTPTVGIGKLQPTIPALEATATTQPSPVPTETPPPPTNTPEPTATRPPELSWPVAYDLRDQIRTKHAEDKPEGSLIINNLASNEYDGNTGRPDKMIPLNSPFTINVQFDYETTNKNSGNWGSLTLTTRGANEGKSGEGLIQTWFSVRNDLLWIEITDSSSGRPIDYSWELKGIRGKRFFINFSDSQGKQFRIYDDKGNIIREIDVTKVTALKDGLFSESKLRPGFILTPHSQLTISKFSLNIPSIPEVRKESVPLRELAERGGITVGTSIDFWTGEMISDARYKDTIKREFNLVVNGDGLDWVWGKLRPTSDKYNFDLMDKVIQEAKNLGKRIRGHALIWGTGIDDVNIPDWLKNGNFTQEQLYQIVEDHVKTVVDRYKGTISEWVVINELDWADGKGWAGFPDNKFWNNRLDPEQVITKSFKAAKRADPNAKLIYNNGGNESINDMSNFEYNLMKKLLQQGVPIDGIGMEFHIRASEFAKNAQTMDDVNKNIEAWKQSIIKNMLRFGDLGLGVYITELDLDVGNLEGKTEQEKMEISNRIYKAVIEGCLEVNEKSGRTVCKSITTWGFTNLASWITSPGYPWYPNGEPTLPFDEQYQPTPTFWAIYDALSR